jgi:pyruvate, water dikinase
MSEPLTAAVRCLPDITIADRPAVGGKGASLGELMRAGVSVPPGLVVTTAAFFQAMAVIDPDHTLRNRLERVPLGDDRTAGWVASKLREQVLGASLPDDLHAQLAQHYRELGSAGESDPPVAVRSSATGEDSLGASFAGLQDTFLWVRGADDVLAQVRACWASLYSAESVTYRRHRRLPEADMAMAVVVQRMVDPRCSGVLFTSSPLTGDRSVVAVEASWGLGSAIVGGEVTPDSYTISKVTGEILRRDVSTKLRQHRADSSGRGVTAVAVAEELQAEPCLTDEQLRRLLMIGQQIEEHYGTPQDIEWAIPEQPVDGADILLLQSRPETVWANRERRLPNAPKARAYDHVLDWMGTGGKQRDGWSRRNP